MANAFQTASFFSTLRDIDKQKSDKRLEEQRFGLQERQVAGAERRQKFVESEADRARRAETAKVDRDKNIKLIEATIANAGRNLAQLSLKSGKNSDELQFTQEMGNQLEQLSESAERLGLFSKAEVQQKLQSSIDDELSRGLEASTVGVRNVVDPDGNLMSETAARELIQSGQATAADFTIAPTRQETAGAGGFGPSGGKTEQRELNNQATQVNSLIRNIDLAVDAVEKEGAAGQVVGSVAAFANDIGANLESLISSFGVDSETVANGRSILTDLTKDVATDNAQFKSAMIDIAYAKALILNGARPTDTDFKNAYRSLTGGSQDPEIIVKQLLRAGESLEQDFRFRFSQSTGRDFAGTFQRKDRSGAGGGVDAIDVGSSVFQNGVEFIKQPDGSFKPKGS